MDFSLKDLSGERLSLDSYKGKVVLLVFFQTTCPACQDEMSELESIYQKHRSDEFDVLAVNIRENANVVRLFADENKLSFTVLLDEKGKVAGAYKVRFIPRIFILDRTGDVAFNAHYMAGEDLEKEIKKAIK
jgi:peroxiredoxin